MTSCSPGDNPHADQPNFTLADYLQMVRDGEAKYSITEVARLMGWSRALVYRSIVMASVSDAEFDAILDDFRAAGRMPTSTGIVDEIRRRTGRAVSSSEHCPHCGGVIRERRR